MADLDVHAERRAAKSVIVGASEFTLEELRRRIDELDDVIVAALGMRVELARATRPRKGSVRDARREAEVREHVREVAARRGLDPAAVAAVYELVLALCRDVQLSGNLEDS